MSERTGLTRQTWLLLLLLLIAFGLRIFRLEAQSLWWDEGISLHLATSGLAEIVADRAANIHPPLYYFWLKGWVSLVGVGAFTGRYFSALASLLQVTAVYAVSRRWLTPRARWVATGLIVISPLSIIYGQEIRVYAFLPVIYLTLLALTAHLTRRPASRWPIWAVLGMVEWIGLHLHYITLFLAAYISGWALLVFWRQRRFAAARRWLLTQGIVGAASLPWLAAVALNRLAVQSRISTGTFLSDPVPFQFLLPQIWVFHLTGLAGVLARPAVQWLAGTAVVALVVLLLWRRGVVTWRLLSHWLLPLSSALIIWLVRSYSHPRYVAIYAIGLIPLVAHVTAAQKGSDWRGYMRLVGLLPFAAVFLWGLNAYFFDPAIVKDDVRGVARYLEATAAAGDLILVPDSDWSLPFEYRGEAPVRMPDVPAREEMWAIWGEWTAARRRVFVLDYKRGTHDWQDLIPFALEKDGALVNVVDFGDLVVREYRLQRPLSPPELSPVDGRFGPVRVTGAWIEESAPANSAVTLAVQWQLTQPVSNRYRVALRLQDVDGWELAQEDDLLLDASGRPTENWPVGEPVITYHLLPLTPGTPPLRYTVALGLYAPTADGVRVVDLEDASGAPQGQQLVLAAVTLAPAQPDLADGYGVASPVSFFPQPVALAEGLVLQGVRVGRETAVPGQAIFVELLWQGTGESLPDLAPQLSLVQDGVMLAAVTGPPANGRYPTFRWQAGERVWTHRRLAAPPEASAGPADLVLSVDERQVILGTVTISAADHVFEPPAVAYPLDVQFGEVARLVGFDLPARSFAADEAIPLTLYWESLVTGAAVDYTVFTHLLDEDGRLVGQHDAPPDNGRRPTTGWVAGEFISDGHQLTLRETDFRGEGRIEVGLYDPATGTRLQTPNGADFIYLPVTVTITAGDS